MGMAGVLAIIAVCGLLLLLGRAYLLVPLTLFAAATALPIGVPAGFSVVGFTFRFYELLLVFAFVWALFQRIGNRTLRTVVPLAVWLVLGVSVAWLADSTPFVRVVADMRYPVQMMMAVVVAAGAVQVPGLIMICAQVLRISLWISAGFLALGSAGLLTLAGRSEIATLFEAGGEVGATRYLTAATFFALATVCWCVGLAVDGRSPVLATWTWFGPALLVLFLAFSRNHLLGVAVTVGAAVLAVRTIAGARRALVGVIAAGAIAVALVAVAPALTDVPGGSWFASQVKAYSSRVVDGLRTDTLSRDSSEIYRQQEIGYLERAFDEAPIFGHGFGYAYRPPQGQPGTFWSERAPYYSHNFYWWALAKTGLLGLVLILVAVLGALASVVLGPRRGPQITAAAATFTGLLAVSWVAPLPIDAPTSLLIGSALGLLIGWIGLNCAMNDTGLGAKFSDGTVDRAMTS